MAELCGGEGHTPEVIARRVASQEGPQEPLSARERRVALLAGGLAPGDPLFKSELERDMASWAVEQR